MRLAARLLGGLAVAAVVSSGSVGWAMHATDHRFTVWGHVADEGGRPLSGVKVTVRDARLPDAVTTLTHRDGSYEAVLHLHNDNVGDEVVVAAGDRIQRIRATFNPSDVHTERKTEVNFGSAIQGQSAAGEWWPWALAALVTFGVVAWGVARRRVRRQAVQQASRGWKKQAKGQAGGRA